MNESADELAAYFSEKFKDDPKPTEKQAEKIDIWKDYREMLGEEKLNEYILELKRLRELKYKEMCDSPYGAPNGRCCLDVFRPLRCKYDAACSILSGNFGILSPEKAEGWYNVYQKEYQAMTGECFDLSGIIERKYKI